MSQKNGYAEWNAESPLTGGHTPSSYLVQHLFSAQLLSSLGPGLPWFLPPRSHGVLLSFSWGGVSKGNLSSFAVLFLLKWSSRAAFCHLPATIPVECACLSLSDMVLDPFLAAWGVVNSAVLFKNKCFSSLTAVPWAVGRDRSCTGLFSVMSFSY